jgi:uncharacterized membrane-anchored protein
MIFRAFKTKPQPETQTAPVQTESPRRIPGWRFWVPLFCQAAFIVSVPAQDAYTYTTGRTIVLQTVPVDPYDLLRGYSQTLSYNISNPNNLRKLPGGELLKEGHAKHVYVILEAPAQTDTVPPKPWKAVRLSADRPEKLPDNQVALEATHMGWSLDYGLETYYMPEDQRQSINLDISQVQQQPRQARQPRQQQAFVVEAKVDQFGNAVPVSLWVRDRNYRF